MKKTIIAILLLINLCFSSYAQNIKEKVESYKRNFVIANINTKANLLKEASSIEDPAMGDLYNTALNFLLGNSSLLSADIFVTETAVISCDMIKKYKYTQAASNIWMLFEQYKETKIRIAALNALGAIGQDDSIIFGRINEFLKQQMQVFQSGQKIDEQVILAAVRALGNIGDPSSYPHLFTVYTSSISKSMTEEAKKALSMLRGDYAEFLMKVIVEDLPKKKNSALDAALDSDLPAESRAAIAEKALTVGVNFHSFNNLEATEIMKLRDNATLELTEQKWQKASPIAIEHFIDLQTQNNRGQVAKNYLLHSISLLGVMGTQEAAQRLSLYLQIINTETEQGKNYDEQITLAVVTNLGILGDKTAFDYLLYVGYLKYPERIKEAAKLSLQQLRW